MSIPGDFTINDDRVRIRLPHGRIEPAVLDVIALAAEEFGDGQVRVSAHAELWLHGLQPQAIDPLADRLGGVGLVSGHRRLGASRVAVSTLSGRVGGLVDVWPQARELWHLLQEETAAAALGDDFAFGFDDGRGDLRRRKLEVVAVAASAAEIELFVAGAPTGRIITLTDSPAAMLAVAVAHADGGLEAVREAVTAVGREGHAPEPDASARPIGWFTQSDGAVALGAVTESGRLTARQAQFAAAIGVPVLFTANREIVIADLTEEVAETVVRVLAPLGFSFDITSAWAHED